MPRWAVAMNADLAVGLVLLPMAGALVAFGLPAAYRRALAAAIALGWPLLLLPLTLLVLRDGSIAVVFGDWQPPLGIVWRIDGLALVMLWMHAAVGLAALVHAWPGFAPDRRAAATFWPLWLVLMTGANLALVTADLFNLYVALELVTLTGIALVAITDSTAALRAAMRYLLLAMLGSLMYLAGVGLTYAQNGTLAMAGITALETTPLVLMLAGLMVKSAVFPLHVWLPPAYANAPGPVAAMLAAVVGKTALIALWRVWWLAGDSASQALAMAIGVMGVAAIVYGSVAAMLHPRLRMVVAYSSVAQIGLLLLLIPLAGSDAFVASGFHLLVHGLAKAAMFLAAANIVMALGSDWIRRLPGLDSKLPLEAFTLALAGITLIGLPPSGGWVSKWLLLQQARSNDQLVWMVAILGGSLLSAAYVFRLLAMSCFHASHHARRPIVTRPPRAGSLAALLLALAAALLGLNPTPMLNLLATAWPGAAS
ncbi:MAG: proton-conducting transporter membrane subunit [Wenzhouxiangellaceae bacterium]|nr:proton-conducting transporter membrane subunit [Wenzhouxiangellaceae bacterium]